VLWPLLRAAHTNLRLKQKDGSAGLGARLAFGMSRGRFPNIGELRGNRIRLRPLRPAETDAAWRGLASLDEAAHPRPRPEDRRPTASDGFRREIKRSGRLWRGCLDLAIERKGRLVGQIQARTSPKQTLPPGVFELGVVLYRQGDRGKGYGREAVDLLTTWLFELGMAERVQAGTAAGNAPMRAVLEHLGFRLEGIMRGFGPLSDGTRADGALYAVVRRDWQERLA
jgi:RimJ/RimL family protein N-acetyltransferase